MQTLCFLERAGCAGGGKGILCSEEKTFTLSTVDNMRICMEEKVMAFAQNTRDEVRYQNGDGQIVGALAAQPGMKQTTYIKTNTVVRRLTPIECERLQGFPDNYTNIPWRNKPTAPDSRRYKALGNSMAVPVMYWIGKRMMEAREVVYDEAAIDRILYVTPSDDGQLSLF
jgi:site-specific DNA-cytosine methylase